MKEKVSGLMLALLLIGSLAFVFNIQPVKAESTATMDNLIITSPALEPYAIELAEWKNETGISSIVINTTWIYNHYLGVDNQEKIRNGIKAYASWPFNVKYVTLFGDADKIPVRYVYVPNDHPDDPEEYIATDLYYADLDGTWDDNGNGIYGEQEYDDVEGIPDVYIGRLPCSYLDTAQDIVNKIKNYEQQFDKSEDWTKRVILGSGRGDGEEYLELLSNITADTMQNYDIVKLYALSENLSTNTMASQINNGALFLNFAGHGDPGSTPLFSAGWLFKWDFWPFVWNGFGISDVQALTNDYKLPVVTAISCSTATFDDTDCIGEAFVMVPDGGSIAYFGATRLAHFLFGNIILMLYQNFNAGASRLGKIWGKSVEQYVEHNVYFSGDYQSADPIDVKTFMEFVLLGDPTLQIYNRAHDLSVIGINSVKTVICQNHTGYIIVTVKNCGFYAETFNLSLYANGILVGTRANLFAASGSYMGFVFTWDATGWSKGNYTISAYIDPVPNETDTSDNVYSNGWIVVSMLGDIIGPEGYPDGKCDIKDVAMVARLYGVIHPDPRYDANCDLTGSTKGVPDGKIDIKDVALVAKHYGEIDP